MSVYLDHAATGLPRRPSSIEAALAAVSMANPGRGLHTAQAEAAAAVERARASVRALVGWGTVCFVAGATHALSQAILGMRPRPRAVAVDPLAHNAVRRALLRLGVPVIVLPHDAAGRIDLDALARDWPSVDLVAVTHGSNVTGLVQPAAAIADIARRRGARTVIDAAQTAGVIPLELEGAAAVAFSAHKGLRALPGSGALVVAPEVELEPLIVGGTGFDALGAGMPDDYPARLEAGTPNLPGIAAMGAAAREAAGEPQEVLESTARLREAVERGGARCIGMGELPIVSFAIDGMAPVEVEEVLDRSFGITVRAGLHCCPSVHEFLETLPTGTVRASAGSTIVADDFSALEDALRAIIRLKSR